MKISQIREQQIFFELDENGEDRKGYRSGDSEWYEPFTDEPGQLFKALQREYGRCVSKCYVDYPVFDSDEQQAIAIGWVFRKKTGKQEAIETWVEYRAS